MILQGNLATNTIPENKIISLDIVTAKEKFNKFYANFLTSSWDNKVISVSNFLSLPLSECILDTDLKLLENTNGSLLGHSSIYSFITSSSSEFGLEMPWEKWSYIVKAMIQKVEFGINSSSPDDVILQMEDVSNALGRVPVSKFEFNLAKDQIIREQVSVLQQHHQSVVSEMQSKVSSLIHQLDDERREKLDAIEKLDEALKQINSIRDESQRSDLEQYVERSLYENIVEELDQLREHHETIFQGYLDRIAKLTLTNKNLSKKIGLLQTLIKMRDQEITLLSCNQEHQSDVSIAEYTKEIANLKKQIIELLKTNIHKQKVINKQKVISKKKSDINALLRCHKERLQRKTESSSRSCITRKKNRLWESRKGIVAISLSILISSIATLYLIS